MSSNPNLGPTQYQKTDLRKDDPGNDQLTLTQVSTTGSDAVINSKCELQLTYTNFDLLKKKLKDKLTELLGTVSKTDESNIALHRTNLKAKIVNAKKKLDTEKSKIEGLVKNINEFNVSPSLDGLVDKIDFDESTQKDLLTQLQKTKTELSAVKSSISNLQGLIPSKGVFGEIEAELATMKKSRTPKRDLITNIDLSQGDKIVGHLYTSWNRITNKNISGVVCTVIKVNAKDKIYTVSYQDEKDKTKYVDVKQSELCLVGDGKKYEGTPSKA